eukprot:4176257-Pyramimonas_sp.AAC.1
MGWTWASWWCQRVHERLVERCGGQPEERLQDRRVIPSLAGACHLEYVDNFVAISTVASKVHRLASAVVEGFREA